MRQRNAFFRHKLAILVALLVCTCFTPATAFAQDEEVVIATWNLEWFYDHNPLDTEPGTGRNFAAPNEQEYMERVITIADAIADVAPAILALQEIENKSVVQDLAHRLMVAHGLAYTVAFVQGGDTATGQDVAFLIADDVEIHDSGSRFEFFDSFDRDLFRNITKHLKIDVSIEGEDFTFITVHLLSRDLQGRLKQARTLRSWITTELDPASTVIVLGDFNAGKRFNQTTPDTEIGIIRGFQTPLEDDDLYDVHALLGDRATHVSNSELDRILLTPRLQARVVAIDTRRDLAIRGNQDSGCDGVCYAEPIESQDLSDHFPLVMTLSTQLAQAATAATDPTMTAPQESARAEPAEAGDEEATAEATEESTVEGPEEILEEDVVSLPSTEITSLEELLNARLASIEAEVKELRREIEEIKLLILALNE